MKCKNCGCDEKEHELYEFMDGGEDRIGCMVCGENKCKKFAKTGGNEHG